MEDTTHTSTHMTGNNSWEHVRLNDRDPIRYLLGNAPSWMMNYGMSVMAATLIILLVLSYLIRYPDVIEARGVLTTPAPPIRLISKTGGRISELLVADKQQVVAGQVLAVMENTASWKDVLTLESSLEHADMLNALPANLSLGELQEAYSIYCRHKRDMYHYGALNEADRRIGFLRKQIQVLEDMQSSQVNQLTTMRQEFAFVEKNIHRQRLQHSDKLIADVEYEVAEADYLAKKRQVENSEAALLHNQLQIRQIESRISELQYDDSDEKYNRMSALDEDMQHLINAIIEWKHKYLVVAPISGSISFARLWSAQQHVGGGEEILAVVPAGKSTTGAGSIVTRAMLPVENVGKVIPGQRAFIHLDGYPALEFGILETWVTNIALLPLREGTEILCPVELYLSDTLKTSYGKIIPFRQEMPVGIRIVAEDRRVLERIFDQFNNLLKNR